MAIVNGTIEQWLAEHAPHKLVLEKKPARRIQRKRLK
jgi:hypothetical protein